MLLLVEEFESLIGSRCSHLNPVFPRQLFLDHPLISLFAEIDHPLISAFFAFFVLSQHLLLSIRRFCARNSNPMEQKIRILKGVWGLPSLFMRMGSTPLFSQVSNSWLYRRPRFFLSFLKINLFSNWIIVNSQCHVSFKYTAKWFSYMCVYVCYTHTRSFADSFLL